jgi:hypothetical protein
MRILWRSTTSLLRQYPILWLPVLVAEIVNFNLRWFERLLLRPLRHQLILWFSQAHSVLSTTPVPIQPTGSIMIKTALLTAPLEWGMQFLCAAVTVASLVATAAILQSIAKTGRGSLRAVIAPITSSRRRILIFSLQLFAFGVIAGIVIAIFLPLLSTLYLPYKLAQFFSLSLKTEMVLNKLQLNFLTNYILLAPITLISLYIMAPLAVRLLQPPDSIPAKHQAKQARIAALFVSVATCILSYLLFRLDSLFIALQYAPTGPVAYLFHTFTSFIAAGPWVPLFIAFYLISNPESPLVGASVAPPEEDAAPSLETSL